MIQKLIVIIGMVAFPFVFTFEYLPLNLVKLIKSLYFGRLNFATFWSLLLAHATCVLYFVNSITSYFVASKNSYSNRVLQITMSISYPISIAVTSFYWLSMLLDRSIIYPEALKDDRIAIWRELTLHLAPYIFLCILKSNVFINVSAIYLVIFCILYATLNLFSFYKTGNWPYALMSKLTLNQNLLLHLILGLLVLALFMLIRNNDSKKLRLKKVNQLKSYKKKNK